MVRQVLFFAGACALVACSHNDSSGGASAPKADTGAIAAIQKRASFDLGCPIEQVQVVQIEQGTFMHPATYGATCGSQRASYLERMGTIIKQ